MPERRISVVLSANATALRAGLLKASADVRRFGGDVKRASLDTSLHGDRIGRKMLLMGAAVVAAFGIAAFAAAQFEREMYNVATISGFVRNQWDIATSAIIEMSTRVPQSAATLARGLYDVASSGFAGADGLVVTEQAAKAASAGLSDTATAARAITGVLNAYGLGAKDARVVSDILFQTVNLGVVTFEELAQQIGDVLGASAAAKVPIKDVGAAIATITLAGIPAAEATTALNRTIQSLLDPSEALNNALLEMGYTSGEQALKADGLQVVLTKLRDRTGDSTTAFLELFPEIRAARGALALTAAEGENWSRVARGMDAATKGSGATQRALEQQQKSLAFQLQLTKNQIVAVAIALGQGLLPPLKFIAGAAKRVFLGFQEMPGPLKIVMQIVAALGTGILILGGGFLVLAPRIRDAQVFIRGLGTSATVASTALRGLSLALGVIGIALTVYSLIQGGAAEKQQEINDKANKYLDILRQTNGELTKAVTNEVGRNLAQNDAVKTARDLGIEGDRLVRIAQQRNAADRIANITRRNIIASARAEGDAIDKVVEALDTEHSSTRELLLQGPAISDKTKEQIRARIELTDEVRNESEAIKRAIDIYNQEQQTKEKSKKLTAEQKRVLQEEKAALQALGLQAETTGGEISNLTDVQKGLHDVIKDGPDPLAAYQTAVAMFRENTDVELNAAGQAWWNFRDNATFALADFLNQMQAQLDALNNWEFNLGEVARRGGVAFAMQLAKLGPEAAPLVAQIATSTQPEFDRARILFEASARKMGEGHAVELDKWLKISAAVGTLGAGATAQAIADATGLKLPEVQRIAAAYGISLVDAVNAVMVTLGGKSFPFPKVSFFAEGGIRENHVAQIARAGEWRVWAEDETGGEAYIPLAKGKRQRSEKILATVADLFGYGIVPMAVGGINEYIGRLPKVPEWQAFASEAAARTGDEKKYAQAVWRVATAHNEALEREAAATRGGGLAATEGLNPEFLRRFNEYNAALGGKFRIVSGYRSYQQQAALYARYLAGQGNLAAPPGRSQHEKGLAIDHSPNATSSDMGVARTFRLHYPVGGEPWHVEPFARGGIRAALFDRGGWLQPGTTLAVNNTGRPERVGDAPISVNTTLHFHGAIVGVPNLRREVGKMLDENNKKLTDSLRRKRGAPV